jgi:hypothetical protein
MYTFSNEEMNINTKAEALALVMTNEELKIE